jgi:hypothetical protein
LLPFINKKSWKFLAFILLIRVNGKVNAKNVFKMLDNLRKIDYIHNSHSDIDFGNYRKEQVALRPVLVQLVRVDGTVSAQAKERHSFSAGRNSSCPSTLCGLASLTPALS